MVWHARKGNDTSHSCQQGDIFQMGREANGSSYPTSKLPYSQKEKGISPVQILEISESHPKIIVFEASDEQEEVGDEDMLFWNDLELF